MARKRTIFTIMSVFFVSLLLVGCSGVADIKTDNSKTPEGDSAPTETAQVNNSSLEQKYYRTDNGEGGVEVGVLWGAPAYFRATGNEQMITDLDLENNIAFEISMTTHSGDLRSYPMSENAELTVGEITLKPTKWELSSQDSHHPTGLLFFSAKDEAGNPLLNGTAVLGLNLKDLNGVPERKFFWEVQQQS